MTVLIVVASSSADGPASTFVSSDEANDIVSISETAADLEG
jgi:hypothetical protein